jgi:crossover junction endodeoxyribonuclease RuvC
MELVAGIDPGANGSITLLETNGLPYHQILFAKSTDHDIVDWLTEFRENIKLAIVEQVHAMPKQGVASTFKFGFAYGVVVGILTASKIPIEYATPQKWQKEIGCLSKGDKNVTKHKAQDLFPNLKITHATADSMLIAEYARRKYNLHKGV